MRCSSGVDVDSERTQEAERVGFLGVETNNVVI